MGVLTIPATSIQYVQQQITYIVNGAAADPTIYPIAVSFVPQPNYGPPPDPASWSAGRWWTDPGPIYWGGCLIGTASDGGVVLAKGSYAMAFQITTPIEVPVIWGWTVNVS